ncbi:hypothetical protein [Erwinia sp. LJJL01]|uniref:hypothetical protein n=1 Tax=Erwinia sp. LJJL01 TaxID=3391839 RepID=UPI0039B08EFC
MAFSSRHGMAWHSWHQAWHCIALAWHGEREDVQREAMEEAVAGYNGGEREREIFFFFFPIFFFFLAWHHGMALN